MKRRNFIKTILGTAAVAAVAAVPVPVAGAAAEVIPEVIPVDPNTNKYSLSFSRALYQLEAKIEELFRDLVVRTEINDDKTRSDFTALIEEEIKKYPVIIDSRVLCNTDNNTPEVIDRGELVGDIYLKEEGANFVHLNFIGVRTGVVFEEVNGRWG